MTGQRHGPGLLHIPEECWKAATALLCGGITHPLFEQRASFALYAALHAAMVLGRPALEFAADLSRRGLREFCQELNRLGDEEVRANLRHFLGTSEEELPWDQLEHDRFLTNSWLHLVVRLARWQSQEPGTSIPA